MLNNIGLPGLLLIAVVVLVMFGKGKVSSLMGEVGKGITAFKKGVSDGTKEIETAQAEGLDYALIVREMTPNMSELKKVYKVDVKTGAEQLVRSAGFKGLTLNDLRKLIGAGNQKRVLNTSAGEDIQHKADNLSGCAATFITPDAFLFKEIEVNKQSKPNMTKLPVVKNPLEL